MKQRIAPQGLKPIPPILQIDADYQLRCPRCGLLLAWTISKRPRPRTRNQKATEPGAYKCLGKTCPVVMSDRFHYFLFKTIARGKSTCQNI